MEVETLISAPKDSEVLPPRDSRRASIGVDAEESKFVSLREEDANVNNAVDLLNGLKKTNVKENNSLYKEPLRKTDINNGPLLRELEVREMDSNFQKVITPTGGSNVFTDINEFEANSNYGFSGKDDYSFEHVFGPPASPRPEVSDDLIFEYNVLKRKLIAETTKSRELCDKLHFIAMKDKLKAEKLQSTCLALRAKTKLLQQKEEELKEMAAQKKQLLRKVSTMEERQMQLEFDKYKLQNPVSRTPVAVEDEEAAHVRGVEKAKMLLAHQLFRQQSERRIEEHKKENNGLRRDLRRKLQLLENMCMSYEDEMCADTLQSLVKTLQIGRYQSEREARSYIARDLRFNERVSMKAPDDEHVKALIQRSDYSSLFSQCKNEFGSSVRDMKELLDRSLQSLWLLFNEKTSRFSTGSSTINQKPFRRTFEDFYKTIEQALLRSKQVVAEFARKSNGFVKAVMAREKDVYEKIRTTRFSTTDQECSVEIRPATPEEMYELRHDVSFYQSKLRDRSQEMSEKQQEWEMRVSKAESNLEYLHLHIINLHRSLFNTLHLVYKHRFRWTPRLPDPLRELRIPEATIREKAMEVHYNHQLGSLLQADRNYMETFGHYMISDEFGANTVEKRRHSVEEEEIRPPKAPSNVLPGALPGGGNARRRSQPDISDDNLPSFAQPIGHLRGSQIVKKRFPVAFEEHKSASGPITMPGISEMRRADSCKVFPSRREGF